MSPDEPTRLHFAYAASEPNLEAFDVKRVVPARLLGEPAALTIIGESHYVGVPALDFHEVCSCKPLAGDSTAKTPLESGVEREFAFENDRLRVETDAEVRDIGDFPGPEGADAAFRFGPDAWTTIQLGIAAESDAVASDSAASYSPDAPDSPDTPDVPDSTASYETYHTYPEYGLAVYTITELHPASERTDGALAPLTSEPTDD